jgi:hypothetical protein
MIEGGAMPACERDIAENAGEGGLPVALGVVEYLNLAATPVFAIMALFTAVTGSGPDLLCSAAHASPLGGMVPMYLLMSAFHMAPWLRLIAKAVSSRDIAPTNS